MAGWPVISLGTSSIEDSARISVSIEDHTRDSSSDQVMSFMGGKNLRRNYGKTRAAVASRSVVTVSHLSEPSAWLDLGVSGIFQLLLKRRPRESCHSFV